MIASLGADLTELRRARALWQANRFEEAVQLFEQTALQHPKNLLALIDASRALGARFEVSRAEFLLDRFLELAGQRAELLHLAGQSYRMIFRPDKAMACFEQVVAKTGGIPDAFLELAVQYERRHRLLEAESLLASCLRAKPDYWEAHFLRARVLRRLKRDADSDIILRRLTENQGVHPSLQAQAWAEIAQALDRQGQYSEAWKAMLRGKQASMPGAGPYLQESDVIVGHLNRLTRAVSREHFQRWADAVAPISTGRTAILTSFPRSGTTLLEQVLDAHSQLVSSDEREAFSRDIFPAIWMTPNSPIPTVSALDAAPESRLAALRNRYFSFMEAALNQPIGSRIHLDKNPPLTLVLPGFLRLFPHTHILFALRDPRDVVVSCLMQYLPLNPFSVSFLTVDRAARRYANDMACWLVLREKIISPWLQVRYEDTVHHTEREAQRAVKFLGLEWEHQVLHYRERLKDKPVASPTYEAVSQPIYTRAIGRWHHYEEYLAPVQSVLKSAVDAFGY